MNIQSYAPGWLDHSLFMLFAVLWPAYGFYSYRRYWALLVSGQLTRLSIYRTTMVIQWTFFFLCIAMWFGQGREPEALGLGMKVDTGMIIAAIVTAVAIALMIVQFRALAGDDPGKREQLAAQLDGVEPLLPHTLRERRAFFGLSLTAGVVEELLWRGFLIGYLAYWMPAWLAAIVATVLFGLGHAYQGLSGVPRVMLVGGFLAALYLLSGSLWLPMILHVAIDAIQGYYVHQYLRRNDGRAVA
ncbi:CPBP family intramembrane glutamic endopeptidase [Marinihelvus fidelis]|nr:CPBP family intramembrane glutamic endopeptidase [Marinihelvus fidelis]